MWIQELGLAIDYAAFEAIVPLVELNVKQDKQGTRIDNDAALNTISEWTLDGDDSAAPAAAGVVHAMDVDGWGVGGASPRGMGIARSDSVMLDGGDKGGVDAPRRCACAWACIDRMRSWDYAMARCRATPAGLVAQQIVLNFWVQFFLDAVVGLNTICIMMELTFQQSFGSTDAKAGWWSSGLEAIFLAIYCVELVAKLSILGARKFFDDGFFNHLDFVTVVVGVSGSGIAFVLRHAMESAAGGAVTVLLKLPRLLRLVRIIRLLKLFDDIVYTFAKIVSPVCRYVLVLVIGEFFLFNR